MFHIFNVYGKSTFDVTILRTKVSTVMAILERKVKLT